MLRRKLGLPSGPRAWRIPGGLVIPLLGAAGSLVLFAAADQMEWMFAAATLVVGVAVAALTTRGERRA